MRKISKTLALEVSLLGITSVILLEGFAGIFSGSLALLSDAGHAVFDALSTLILLIATVLASKPPDEDHTYGHGKIESLGALIGGITLLLLTIVLAGLAALRMTTGVHARPTLLGYVAASYTMGIEVIRILVLSAALKSGSSTVRADLYHAGSDFFSTSLVFVALGLTSVGIPVGDSVASLCIAAVLGYLSIRLIYTSMLDLSDAISGKLVQRILVEIQGTNDVLKCKSLRVRRVGDTTYVDAVCAVSPFAGITDADLIASRIETNLTKLLGRSAIMIHVEPLEWDLPAELRVRSATSKIGGVRGLHNVSVTSVSDGLFVTLHVQVDPSLPLDKAHEIARSVEQSIENTVPRVRQVTVHLEPSLPERSQGTLVDDEVISDTIRAVVRGYRDVREISAITTYKAEGKLYVNVHCLFSGDAPIAEVHDMISRIEESLRQKFNNAIVTIHPEPAKR
jgi:cation diffusion facilitator family transporter